ncbi:PAX3- and PAX7-binding protein 1-like [Panonychus citri]|uniref:PAX3- and PAX7-binding protein 1-like n=1 Tax=Panonychus citri TaxID=50023 RepID=UPI002307F769|nr:PAX3- and PAX7-binding protein 1-like [Panonychus citri]
MSLFKKPKSKINVRVTRNDSDEDDESRTITNVKPVDEKIDILKQSQNTGEFQRVRDDGGTGGIAVLPDEPASSSVLKPSSQSAAGEKKFEAKVKLKLSFGDDEEDADVFQVKKSAYSRRIAKQMKREKKRKEKEEKLEETKRSDKLSNSEPFFSFNQRSKEDEKSEIETSDLPPTPKEKNIHFKEISSHQFKPMREGQFPSAKEIYDARKKREEDRKKMKIDNTIEDFISVEEETAAERIALGHMDDEQPVYEEEGDNDDDDEDEDDRIDFAVDREAIERERTKEAFIQAQEEDKDTYNNRNRDIDDSDDSEDEIDLWEKEQIRKGVGFSIGSTNRDHQPNNQLNDLMTKLDLPSTSYKSSISSSIPYYLPRTPSSKATEDAIKQLSDDICEAINQMNRAIVQDEEELKNIREQREQLMNDLEGLEKQSGLDDKSMTDFLLNWKKGQKSTRNIYDKYASSDDD